MMSSAAGKGAAGARIDGEIAESPGQFVAQAADLGKARKD
jgi:hypothetical protein